MKKILFFILIVNISFSQDSIEKNKLKIVPEFNIGSNFVYFMGNNYLSKGHANPTVGLYFNANLIQFNKFELSGEIEKNWLKVIDKSIGGNIDKTIVNTYKIRLSYLLKPIERFYFEPNINYGQVNLRQFNGNNFFGNQKGNTLGFGMTIKYKVSNRIKVFSTIDYNFYSLNVKTTSEYENYFDNTKAIVLNLGFTL